jgi:predicted MFS family arabinose efflux permease
MSPQITTLRLISLAGFASMASMRVCDSFLVALAVEFQVSTGDASSVISAFAIAYGLMQLVYGPLADRVGKVRVILFATIGCAVFSVLTALAPSLNLLVIARAGLGALAAGIIPLSLAWIGDQVSYDKRQETLAKLTAATVSGMMVGQWLGGLAAETIGWRFALGGLSVVFAIAAIWLFRRPDASVPAVVPSDPSGQGILTRQFGTSFQLLASAKVRGLLLITVLHGALSFGTLAFVPSRLIEGFGFSVSTAGAIMVLYGMGGLAYSQLARRLVAALGEQGLCLVGASLLAAAMLTLAWASQPWLAVLACPVGGVGFYMLHGTLQTRATQMAPQARATAVSLFACLLFFGQSIGVWSMGKGVDQGAFALCLSAAAFGVLIIGMLVASQTQTH